MTKDVAGAGKRMGLGEEEVVDGGLEGLRRGVRLRG